MRIDRPISASLFLMASLLLGFFLVAPAYRHVSALQLDLAQKRAEFNAQYDYYASIAKTYQDLQMRQDELRKIDNGLPQEADLGQLAYFFQKKSKEAGLLMRGFVLSQSSAKNAKQTVKELVFSLDLFGDYASLLEFVAALERSDRLFQISSVSFGSSAQQIAAPVLPSENPGLFSFNLEVRTHSY